MKLLVATHAYLLEIVLDSAFNLKRITPIDGFHYGMCHWPQGCMATIDRNNSVVTVYNCSDQNPPLETREKFILNGNYKDIHQIARQGEFLLVTNTRFNELSLVRNGQHVCGFRFGGFSKDINHINSVFPLGENKMLVMLHNGGKATSEICVMERDDRTIREVSRFPLWDTGCHNIFTDGVRLVYNASSRGDFVVVDMASQSVARRLRFSGHTKGLAVTDDFFIIGCSDHARRDKRTVSYGYLTFLDRKSLCVKAIVDLNSKIGPIGNINEIKCLTGNDFSHGSIADLEIDWEKLRMSDRDWAYKFFFKHTEFLRRRVKKYMPKWKSSEKNRGEVR
jgi:hypothetical protein